MDLLTIAETVLAFPVLPGSRVFNLTGSAAALLLSLEQRPFVALEKDEAAAESFAADINFFRRVFGRVPVHFLPDPEGRARSGERARLMHGLAEDASLVASIQSLGGYLWSREAIGARTLVVKKGIALPRERLEEFLTASGYRHSAMVVEKGDFSRRNWIIDVFPSASENAVRVEFFGEEVEEIRTFDIESQRTLGDLDECLLYPASEPSEGGGLLEATAGKNVFCLHPETEPGDLPPTAIILSRFSIAEGEGVFGVVDDERPQVEAPAQSLRGLGILHEEGRSLHELPGLLRVLAEDLRVILVASSQGQAERIRDILREGDVIAPFISPEDLNGSAAGIAVTVGRLSSGLLLRGVLILTEREIFGERRRVRQAQRSRVARLLSSLDDLSLGDYVVHRDHGIGRFAGMAHRIVDEARVELLQIEYEDGRLYIPVQNIQTIGKFRAEEGVAPRIDRIGGKTWQRKKERARKRINELAERLLALYARRSVARGFRFSPETELHREFDSFFPYEETPDQAAAISEIKGDMESEKPMDRLICGDVGYGKTEVAMRAAFKAVFDNRQVAVLVPTTILAEQHYQTFRERFSGFPVTIDFLSRFKTRDQTRKTLKALGNGEIDIIIGTHGILSRKVAFSRLGLLIVDEEHRFGVGQKERIKELTRDIDVLTMTATPIPRTLHMALSGIRDVSVIESPPEERMAVKTFVTVFTEQVIREAIGRELERKGQVFFVHNRIGDIDRLGERLRALFPEASIAAAHGQMDERRLEDVMHRFFGGEVDILVSTAIIGSGLDIPRANTIIVDRADKMGLADLYQLRGRVGRGRLRGYAHFLVPEESLMTEDARKRVQAVAELSYLGAGFRLALKDLEIRGAGNIFGPEQSGHIHEIGFDLYVEMLEQAVAELQGVEIREEREPSIEATVSAFIPEGYIDDEMLRLSLYRRISGLKSERNADDLAFELEDRFGAVPPELSNLLDIMRLKILGRELSILRIEDTGNRVRIAFSPDTPVQPGMLLDLQREKGRRMRFLPEGFEIELGESSWKDRSLETFGALRILKELIDQAISKQTTES